MTYLAAAADRYMMMFCYHIFSHSTQTVRCWRRTW